MSSARRRRRGKTPLCDAVCLKPPSVVKQVETSVLLSGVEAKRLSLSVVSSRLSGRGENHHNHKVIFRAVRAAA